MAHLYQSADVGRMIGIFLTTFLGAGLFAWLFVEWKFNLWVPIFLHMLMNLSWMMFSVGDDALGGVGANVFRIATIAAAIIGTIWYKRRTNEPLLVRKENLWLKNELFH